MTHQCITLDRCFITLCYRSFEYCVKWKLPMYPRRSSRPPKASKRSPQRSPSPNEEVIQRRWRGKRQRTGLREAEADDNLVNTDKEEEDRDIIDVINSTLQARRVAEEDEVKFVEVTDEGVDDSDEDCVSVTSSIASGPSVLHNSVSPKKLRPPQGLCSACKTLYQKAKKMKAPIKSKLLDNDPKSLTCDQWVLIKSWRPRRLPNARGKLLIRVQLVKKRLAVNNGANRPARCGGDSPACSRPHAFLQRNLRRRVRVPVKKKSRRKRTRDGSQGRRVAKQQRLLSNNRGQRVSSSPASGPSGSAGFEGRSDQEVNDESDTNPTLELIPSTVTMETTKPREVPPEQKAPKKKKTTTGGFRDLLAQLRGNSSMIVRETR
ncbi:uncharacterized protein LOC142956466 isoform X1 [Anarhichas minor]|uniref:uncharacterized protein LOC142956466 isoform X1 n=2 Tax=Anarhichas minor TaxID=65739 RepID=UPI003F73E024